MLSICCPYLMPKLSSSIVLSFQIWRELDELGLFVDLLYAAPTWEVRYGYSCVGWLVGPECRSHPMNTRPYKTSHGDRREHFGESSKIDTGLGLYVCHSFFNTSTLILVRVAELFGKTRHCLDLKLSDGHASTPESLHLTTREIIAVL